MFEDIEWLKEDFITLNETRKNNNGLSLILEIVKFTAFLVLIQTGHGECNRWIFCKYTIYPKPTFQVLFQFKIRSNIQNHFRRCIKQIMLNFQRKNSFPQKLYIYLRYNSIYYLTRGFFYEENINYTVNLNNSA